MKLIVDIKNIKNLEKYQVHGLVFNHEFLSDTHEGFLTIDEINQLVGFKKNNRIEIIANVNRIFTENEISDLYNHLETLLNLEIDYFIFSDLAVLQFFKNKKLEHKLIYNARTIITNTEDALFWKNLGIYGSFVANELPLEDIKSISQIESSCLVVYGYHQIFYSKRNLVSLYFEHKKIEQDVKHKNLDLIEEIRDDRYPITETNIGTFIYSPYKYGIFQELAELDKLKMIKISSTFIPEDELFEVLRIYKAALEEGFTDSLLSELKEMDEKINSGFLYKKTVLLKGDE